MGRLPKGGRNTDVCCGPDRTISYDLAKRAERAEILRSVQVGSASVLILANPGNFGMVVKDFGGEKVEFTRQ